nr:TPA: polyprotein [Tanacetum cinerariifolium]
SQVRQLIIMEDPYRGSTHEQDRAYRDLDRITCEETKNLRSFLEDFRQLAIKSRKLYFPSTTEKLFAKLPPSLSKKIEELLKARHPGLSAGFLLAIKFTHTFVSEMCKYVALAKELKDLSLCSAIPIPDSYLDITFDHKPGSAGRTSITLDSVHAGGKVHGFGFQLIPSSSSTLLLSLGIAVMPVVVRSSTQTTELPTQEDQIRGYRAMTRSRYQAARATRRVFGRNNYNITLETVVDLERQLELSRERRANLVTAEVLYSNNRSTARHRVYQHYSEQRILCVNDNQTNLPLCNQQSYQSLRTSVLRDTRWEDSRQIIGTIEVDLSAGTQLVYMFPDMVLSIDDFHNHVEVAIQTHGYDTWQGGESNLLVTMAMIGRLSNTNYMGFQYSMDNVVDHLT